MSQVGLADHPERVLPAQIPIDEHPEPELQPQQGPQFRRVVLPRHMTIDAASHGFRLEQPAPVEPRVPQEDFQRPSQRPSQPGGQRNREALFGTIDRRWRDETRRNLLENVLRPKPFEFER